MRTPVYLIATPIGDYLQDMSVAALHALRGVSHVFLEAQDGFAERLQEQGILGAEHQLHFLDHPQVEQARTLIEAHEPFAILASSGIPCFLDPGRHIVAACLAHHLADVELTPLGVSSALDAALCMCGLDVDLFHFNGHYPENYVFEQPAPDPRLPLVYFVRGPAVCSFVREVAEQVPGVRQLILLKDIRKKRRARVTVLRDLASGLPDVPADVDDADYVGVIDRRGPEVVEG